MFFITYIINISSWNISNVFYKIRIPSVSRYAKNVDLSWHNNRKYRGIFEKRFWVATRKSYFFKIRIPPVSKYAKNVHLSWYNNRKYRQDVFVGDDSKVTSRYVFFISTCRRYLAIFGKPLSAQFLENL